MKRPGRQTWVLLVALWLGACGSLTSTPVVEPPAATAVIEAPSRAAAVPTSAPTEAPQMEAPSPPAATTPLVTATPGQDQAPVEQMIRVIPLFGPAASPEAEFSGLAWYGDKLVLLPQYPGRQDGGADGALLAIERAAILRYVDGETRSIPEPISIPFVAPDLAASIAGFEGYEAIAFHGDRVFLTIEANAKGSMHSYIVAGSVAPDLAEVRIDPTTLTEIAQPAQSPNKSDESLVVVGEQVLAIYEANGVVVNQEPVAHSFTLDLEPAGTVPFPAVEYRITDATALDSDGRFWAINYFFPGEAELKPAVDPIARQWGEGPTHTQYEYVERLLEFQVDESGIRLVDRPPIQLALIAEDARNWEGIVRLDGRGFLLVTDKFPETILAFVPGVTD